MEEVFKLVGFILLFGGSFLVFKDAKARGMNAIGWTIFVLLFAIIAVPIYLIARKPKVETSDHSKKRGGTEKPYE